MGTDFSDTALDALGYLEPMSDRQRAMFRLGLRDFPYVLLTAATSVLKSVFGLDERMCIANLIWKAVRRRVRGKPLDYGTELRGFYYRPVLAVPTRLGLMAHGRDPLPAVRCPRPARPGAPVPVRSRAEGAGRGG